MKNMKEFAKKHDIQAHLLGAVDDLTHSDWSIFEGLQNGAVKVLVTWDGVNIHFMRFPTLGEFLPNASPELAAMPTMEEYMAEQTKKAAEESGIFEPNSISVTVEKVEEKPEETQPQESPKPRKKRSD